MESFISTIPSISAFFVSAILPILAFFISVLSAVYTWRVKEKDEKLNLSEKRIKEAKKIVENHISILNEVEVYSIKEDANLGVVERLWQTKVIDGFRKDEWLLETLFSNDLLYAYRYFIVSLALRFPLKKPLNDEALLENINFSIHGAKYILDIMLRDLERENLPKVLKRDAKYEASQDRWDDFDTPSFNIQDAAYRIKYDKGRLLILSANDKKICDLTAEEDWGEQAV